MPCYTITTAKLELKNANPTLLKKAIEKLMGKGTQFQEARGVLYFNGGTYTKATGILEVRNEAVGRQIKRNYSGEVVYAQAKRFGWQVKQTAENKYEIIKR